MLLYGKLNEVGNEIMSNIRINYLSYRVVPLIKNGNTPVLENKPYRVEPISAISTNVGYNPNNPNNGNTFTFKDVFEREMGKQEGLGRKK